MAIGDYFINGYWWLFLLMAIVVILLMTISGYSINDY
jgi:4-hydroxybenzoate polyprenyltransferase